MEKSTSTATQIAEPPPPPPSSVPAQDLPPPATSDQRSSPAMVAAESPSVAMDMDSSPAFTPAAAAPTPTPAAVAQVATTDHPSSSRGRKRALEGNLKIENSNYYKMRLLLKDLRPHVLEVLQTPDFRNCKAAIEIQEKMKLMLELYREMIGETPKNTKSESSLSNGKAINQTPTEKHNSNGNGDSVVGGSAFGWNFVTNGGTEAVYCGMSKEEYRSSHPIPQMEAEVELPNTV